MTPAERIATDLEQRATTGTETRSHPVPRSTDGPTRTIPSDAPAETIARLSVELAASRAQVARMREALKAVDECTHSRGWTALPTGLYLCATCGAVGLDRKIPYRHSPLIAAVLAARESAPDHIAIPRERYDRMVKALGMGQELERNARRSSNAITSIERSTAGEKVESILAAMDAAGKA